MQRHAMISRVNLTQVMGHVLFWSLYILSEYFANRLHLYPGQRWEFFQTIFLTLPALLIPTYFIAWFVVPRYLLTNRWRQFILWIIVIAVVIFYARIKWAELLLYWKNGIFYEMPVDKLLKNIIRDYAIIALAVCISIISDYRRMQLRSEQLYRAKAEAEIKLLKGQLHPHFLFNSLNNIYSLALSSSDQTADSILKLTELLEYLLYRANQDTVLLSKEVELLQHYMDLERLRYGEKLRIETDIDLHDETVYTAPLILLPFAENCFKHGGAGTDGVFSITLKLHTTKEQLFFQITNSKRTTNPSRQAIGGIGLDNMRKRLELLYPAKHHLEIRDTDDTYAVFLTILLHRDKV